MVNPGDTVCLVPNALHVRAGGRELALSFDVASEVADLGEVVPVPGAAPWCLGLVSSRGRLVTLLDAGALFGLRAGRPRYQVVLQGLPVETALAVDEHLGLHGTGPAPDLRLDRERLRSHPAFQPGAPMDGPLEDVR